MSATQDYSEFGLVVSVSGNSEAVGEFTRRELVNWPFGTANSVMACSAT